MVTNIKQTWSRYRRHRRHIYAFFKYFTVFRFLNLLINEFERIAGVKKVRSYPYIVVIDSTNICNLKCPICPTNTGKLHIPKGKMPFDDFKQIVDRISRYTFKIILYNWGEPFLNKEIIPMIAYCHKKRIAVAISSNLNILPGEGAAALVQSGLDEIIVSADGLDQATYEIYRVQGKFDKLVANVKQIVRAKKELKRSNPSIELQYLVFHHNQHQVEEVESFGKNLGVDFVRITQPYLDVNVPTIQAADNTQFVREQYRFTEKQNKNKIADDGFVEVKKAAAAEITGKPIPCFWPWRSVVINWDGTIDPCCIAGQKNNFGNFFEKDFMSIRNGKAFQNARVRISSGKIDESLDIICNRCKGYK